MTCIHCTREAEYDSPENLCAEHWLNWWCANFDDFAPEQQEIMRRETREAMLESGVRFESPAELTFQMLAERNRS